jgi:hypothetical protein
MGQVSRFGKLCLSKIGIQMRASKYRRLPIYLAWVFLPVLSLAQQAPPSAQKAPADWREQYAYTMGVQAYFASPHHAGSSIEYGRAACASVLAQPARFGSRRTETSRFEVHPT